MPRVITVRTGRRVWRKEGKGKRGLLRLLTLKNHVYVNIFKEICSSNKKKVPRAFLGILLMPQNQMENEMFTSLTKLTESNFLDIV